MPIAIINSYTFEVQELLGEESPYVEGPNAIPVDDTVEIGWVYKGNAFSPPDPPTLDMMPADVARWRLEDVRRVADYYSDMDQLLPQEWKDYRNALRVIVTTGVIPDEGYPIEPERPEGT